MRTGLDLNQRRFGGHRSSSHLILTRVFGPEICPSSRSQCARSTVWSIFAGQRHVGSWSGRRASRLHDRHTAAWPPAPRTARGLLLRRIIDRCQRRLRFHPRGGPSTRGYLSAVADNRDPAYRGYREDDRRVMRIDHRPSWEGRKRGARGRAVRCRAAVRPIILRSGKAS